MQNLKRPANKIDDWYIPCSGNINCLKLKIKIKLVVTVNVARTIKYLFGNIFEINNLVERV